MKEKKTLIILLHKYITYAQIQYMEYIFINIYINILLYIVIYTNYQYIYSICFDISDNGGYLLQLTNECKSYNMYRGYYYWYY